jgi:uncharacterized membrane protein YGL010W
MMETASSSETSVNLYQTTRLNIPEDSHLHTRLRENLKSHHVSCSFILTTHACMYVCMSVYVCAYICAYVCSLMYVICIFYVCIYVTTACFVYQLFSVSLNVGREKSYAHWRTSKRSWVRVYLPKVNIIFKRLVW